MSETWDRRKLTSTKVKTTEVSKVQVKSVRKEGMGDNTISSNDSTNFSQCGHSEDSSPPGDQMFLCRRPAAGAPGRTRTITSLVWWIWVKNCSKKERSRSWRCWAHNPSRKEHTAGSTSKRNVGFAPLGSECAATTQSSTPRGTPSLSRDVNRRFRPWRTSGAAIPPLPWMTPFTAWSESSILVLGVGIYPQREKTSSAHIM